MRVESKQEPSPNCESFFANGSTERLEPMLTIPAWEQDQNLKVWVHLRAIGFKSGLESGKILAFYQKLRKIIADTDNICAIVSEPPTVHEIGGMPVVTSNRFFFQIACDRRKDEVALYKAIHSDKTLCLDSLEVLVGDVNRFAFNNPENMGPMLGGPGYRPLRQALKESTLWMPKLSTDLSIDQDYESDDLNDIYIFLRAPHISNAMTINLWNIVINYFEGMGYCGPVAYENHDYLLFSFPVCSDMGDTTQQLETFVDMFAQQVNNILSCTEGWEYSEVRSSADEIEELLKQAIEKGFEPIKDLLMAYPETISIF
jgi:hypothetical protein